MSSGSRWLAPCSPLKATVVISSLDLTQEPPLPSPESLAKLMAAFISLELYVNWKLRCDRTVPEPPSFRSTVFECRAGAESHPNESMISRYAAAEEAPVHPERDGGFVF